MKIFTLLSLISLPYALFGQLRISLESGITNTLYNDVRVPNDPNNLGTYFSFTEDFEKENPVAFLRLEITYLLNEKHLFEFTGAPLQINYNSPKLDTFNFAGQTFANEDLYGVYKFNTYRLSYRYRFINRPKFTLDAGATVLLRDAKIALIQNDREAKDTDLGVVPLLSFEMNYAPFNPLSFQLKGDALVGPSGRAEDIFAGLIYTLPNERWNLKGGYRIIEGGADVNQVYNFAMFQFADVGLQYRW